MGELLGPQPANWPLRIFIIFLMLFSFIGGAYFNDWVSEPRAVINQSCVKHYDGLFMQNYSWEQKEEIKYQYDPYGYWVCVNIQDMSYERAVQVCEHEVSHEMFALECQTNFSKCVDIMDERPGAPATDENLTTTIVNGS